MKTNKRIELSIRSAVREQVIQAYREWRNQNITTDEYGAWMFDIRITSLAIVSKLSFYGVLSEDDEAQLETFIRSLTDTYF